MATSTIYVQYPDGSAGASIKVALSISGGGMTNDVYTDSAGKAVIQHDGTGTATIYVDGMDRGTMRAPGSESVTLR